MSKETVRQILLMNIKYRGLSRLIHRLQTYRSHTFPVRLIFAIVAYRPAASIFGPSGLNSIQHYGRSSMRCSADDASP